MTRTISPRKTRKRTPAAPVEAVTFAAQMIETRLERLLKNREEALSDNPAQGIYQMRVWSRRTRAALDTFAACFPPGPFAQLNKEVKRVTRALGAARDLDVIRERLTEKVKRLSPKERSLGLALAASLEAQRDEKMALAHPVIQKTDTELVKNLKAMALASRRKPPHPNPSKEPLTHFLPAQTLEENARRILEARLETVFSYEPCLSNGENVEELHEMRIAGKRLRYTLEIFAPLFETASRQAVYETSLNAVRALQDRLGTLHDADILVPLLMEFLAQHLKAGYGQTEAGTPVVGTHRVDLPGCAGILTLCRREREARDLAFAELRTAWDSELKTALEKLKTLCESLTTKPKKTRTKR